MAWRIEWTPAAAVEAEAEAAKYALKREGLGDRFLDEIDATIDRITVIQSNRGPAGFLWCAMRGCRLDTGEHEP